MDVLFNAYFLDHTSLYLIVHHNLINVTDIQQNIQKRIYKIDVESMGHINVGTK